MRSVVTISVARDRVRLFFARATAARAASLRLMLSLGLVGGTMALGGCATRGGPVPYNVQNFGEPDLAKAISTTQDYHLGPSDVVGVSVFGVSEFSGDYTVDTIGRIKVPLIGDVAVQGQTADEVSATLKTRLQATYLRNPEVQVVVKSAQSQRVTIDGSVTSPGIFAVSPGTTLVQVVAIAKGIATDGNPRRVYIFRTINGQRNGAAFDLLNIRRGKEPDPQVYPNDIIIVDGNGLSKTLQNITSALPFATIFRPF